MTNALAQRIENIMREIDDISHPPTKTIPISEVEEEISKYKDNTLSIDIQDNTTGRARYPTYGEGILLGFTVPHSTQPTC